MITTETTEPASAEAERVRGRLGQVLNGLEELTALLIDSGADLIDDYSSAELRKCIGRFEGTVTERMGWLSNIATLLDTEVVLNDDGSGRLHYRVERNFQDGAVTYAAFTFVDEDEITDAGAALAEAVEAAGDRS